MLKKWFVWAFLLALLPGGTALAKSVMVDDFEALQGWSTVTSEGARLEIAQDTGHTGKGMRLDFDFQGDGGFVIARKQIPLALPENYAFSFMLRGDAPLNNVEFKLIDPTGENVWRRVLRDYNPPAEWQRIVIKKKHLGFAWGPAAGAAPTQIGTLEFAIAAGTGGKGSLWIDDLRFTELEPAGAYTLTPSVTASTATAAHAPERVLDATAGPGWRSGSVAESQWLQLDFGKNREYGGLVIDWDPDDYATAYQVQTSDDGSSWNPAYTVTAGNGGRDYIPMPEAESRYVRLDLQKSSRGQGYRILTVRVQPEEFSATPQQLFTAIAKDSSRGLYPKYWYGEQTYWTLVGVSGGHQKGLLNEEGMLEIDKGGFSLEPFLYVDGKLVMWSTVEPVQELERGYLPIPSVTWRYDKLVLKITAYATGAPGTASLYARYRIENTGNELRQIRLFLALRPFQVNPPTQSLNMVGGTAPIRRIAFADHQVRVQQQRAEYTVVPLTPPDAFGAVTFDQGPLTDYLRQGKVPLATDVVDPFGYAAGALQYALELPPAATRDVYLAIPFQAQAGKDMPVTDATAVGQQQLETATRSWEATLQQVDIQLPPAASALTDTLKSSLAYVLINRDGPAIQPGPRDYARSWIRDGALTSTALLELGHTEAVRDFLRWYAHYQAADGRIPCCVDQRGPDPVPENDSHGEFIYAVMEYYRYTHDVGFLMELWPAVVKAVGYIDFLRQQRLTEAYRTRDGGLFCGIMPESISHEGYSEHPVHSYWDSFFTLRGLKDAASMATIVGDEERAASFAALRDAFRKDLYASIGCAMGRHKIEHIPASAELGDFDPTSTAIALAPGGELQNLPEPALSRTFGNYYSYFLQRRNGEVGWDAYTPYELRVVGAFIQLGQRQAALDSLNFFLAARRPLAWNQWPEIVWRDAKTLRFIGDMPHTWVGAEYIRAVRSLFAFEREADQALVIAAGLPREWVESEAGVTVKRLPTYYGTLNYSLRRVAPGELRLRLTGDVTLPPGKLVVSSPVALHEAKVNGQLIPISDANSVMVGEFPAEVVLHYAP